MQILSAPSLRLLAGGFLTLGVAMGVGRFFYTPMLPVMAAEYGLGVSESGRIAAANFAGYLAGSIAMMLVPAPLRLATFRIGAVLSVATTLLMATAGGMAPWLGLRALSGIASAMAMISAVGMIADALARLGAEARLGWVFGGVGTGIALSGVLALAAHPPLASSGLWLAAGLGAAACLPFMLVFVGERHLPPGDAPPAAVRRVPRPLAFVPLLVNYTAEGLGYSIFATFIVAIVKSRPGLEGVGNWVWVIAGLAGLPSCLFWAFVAERTGFAAALLAAYLAQIAGILLPVLSKTGAGAIGGAVLFGGTFMAVTLLTMPLGRHGVGGRGFAVLTAGFGLGQMLGPLLAAELVAGPGDYDRALLVSALVVALGAAALAGAMAARGWRAAA